MKRNSIITMAAASVLALTMLAGCGKKTEGTASDFKDGSYKVEYDQPDSRGWKAFAEVTVKDGKITEAKYDYVNADGKLKSEDAEYNKNMKDKAGTSPEEYCPALAKALVEKQDPAKIDKVSGATHSYDGFVEMATKLIDEKIKKGDTTTLELAQPSPAEEVKSELKDGSYKAEYDKADSRGWKAFVEITVKDGKITAAKYDYINADGKLKSEDAEYNKNMKDKSGTNPEEYCPALANALVEKQDPAKIDTVTGATHSYEGFVDMATKLINEKIKKGDATTLVIPQPAA